MNILLKMHYLCLHHYRLIYLKWLSDNLNILFGSGMTQRNCSECPQLVIDEAVEFWIREVGKNLIRYVMSLNICTYPANNKCW